MASNKSTISAALIGIIIVAALLWVGVRQRSAEEPAPDPDAVADQAMAEPVKIGWMGPLTGDAASYGTSIKRGVELAQQDLGADDIKIIFEDSKCEGKDAVSVVNKLIDVDEVQAIIGEVCSGATLAAAPVAQASGVVLISAASTSPKLSQQGGFIFRTVPSDALQGAFAAELVFESGLRKLAILYSNEEYGLGFNTVLSENYVALGGEIVASEPFERTAVDLRTQLTKIKAADPDAVFVVSNSPDSAIAALQQIEQLGITAALYGSEGLKSPDIVSGAGAAAEGLTVTSVSSGTSEFIARHKQAYGESPGPFAAQGYDAFVAIARAVERGASHGPTIRDALRSIEFEGASGYVTFDDHGDVEGNYDVLIVKDGEFISQQDIQAMEAEDSVETTTPTVAPAN